VSHAKQQDFIPVITTSVQTDAPGSWWVEQEGTIFTCVLSRHELDNIHSIFYSTSTNKTLSREGEDMVLIDKGDVH